MHELVPHILVVDDHDAFRELTAVRLRAAGCVCTTARSVPAAIEALERQTFDSILSDHSMPGQSGLDLLAYVHRRRPELPFVLMSSWIDKALRDAAFGGGATAVIEKSELIDSVARVIPAGYGRLLAA